MSSTPVFKSYDQIVKDRAQAEYDRAVEAGIATILQDREFCEIDPTIPGAKKAIVEFCQRYASASPGAVPSLFLIRQAKKHNPLFYKEFFKPYIRTIQQMRQEVIWEICVLLAAHGNMSEADIEYERRRLNTGWTLDKLRARRVQIETAQRLARKSPSELRRMNQEFYDSQVPPIPLLPAEYTAQSLKQLARDNYPEFKRLVSKFGEQVTLRLQNR